MSAPAAQRQRVDSQADLTTTEIYARLHGVPDEVNNAIPNVALRIRQRMGQGPATRTFSRTESSPAVFSRPTQPFLTDAQAQADAWAAIRQETLKTRELKPFASNESNEAVDDLHLSPRGAKGRSGAGSSEEQAGQGRRLHFGGDGEVEMVDGGLGGGMSDAAWSNPSTWVGRDVLAQSKKRLAEAEAGDDLSDAATEVDGDDAEIGSDGAEDEPLPGLAGANSGSTISSINDFPAVFTSPAITQPELFASAPSSTLPSRNVKGGAMGPPQVLGPTTGLAAAGRAVRGLPGRQARTLGKTVSAPVRIGGSWGMDVDEDGVDGFSVSEWSKEEF